MVFLGSLVAVAAALVLLGLFLAGLLGPTRRLAAARSDLADTVARGRVTAAALARTGRSVRRARVGSAPDDREGISS